MASQTRRQFLSSAAAATGLGPASATALARLVDAHVAADPSRIVPFLAEGAFPLDATIGAGLGRRRALDLSTITPETLLTPIDSFFVRTGCPDRLPPTASWKIRVHGLVATPLEISLPQLRRDAVDQGVHVLECAGNARAAQFGFISAARWKGVAVARLLGSARSLLGATQVLISGFDEHSALDAGSVPGASWIFGLDAIRASGAFLATEMNGGPLAADYGYPVRLVVPGCYACTAIKWVNEIALVGDDAPATPQMHEFAGRTHQEPSGPRDGELIREGRRPEGPMLARDFLPATIDPVALPVRVERLGSAGPRSRYSVAGVLWGSGIEAVDLKIRFNPDLEFAPIDRLDRASARGSAWRFWSHEFQPPAPGRYRIELAVTGAAKTRRLDAGYYVREIEIAE